LNKKEMNKLDSLEKCINWHISNCEFYKETAAEKSDVEAMINFEQTLWRLRDILEHCEKLKSTSINPP